jgi:hypothetical protein
MAQLAEIHYSMQDLVHDNIYASEQTHKTGLSYDCEGTHGKIWG